MFVRAAPEPVPAPEPASPQTYWERGYGPIADKPDSAWPLPPAPAQGPPTTLGFDQQMQAMRIATGTFGQDLDLARKLDGGMPYARGERIVGPLGHVSKLDGQRVRG